MAPWLSWLVLGLIAGTLAKFLVPGRDPPGCIITILLGIAGSRVGGVVGAALGWGAITGGALDVRSIVLATLGAIVVLLAGRIVLRRTRRRRRPSGPPWHP